MSKSKARNPAFRAMTAQQVSEVKRKASANSPWRRSPVIVSHKARAEWSARTKAEGGEA